MSPRLLRPLATGFDPRRIAGLEMWFDAADLSSMAQNSDGTTAATATDDPVGFWRDKSGKARHAKQTLNNSRPFLKLADKNGRPGLDFDGSNDVLQCDSGAAFAAAIAIAVVRRTGTPPSFGTIYCHRDSSNVAGYSNSAQNFFVQQTGASTGFIFGLATDGGIIRRNGTALTPINSGQFSLRHAELFPNTTDTNVIGVQGNITTTVGTQFPLIGYDSIAQTPGRHYPMRLYELLIYSDIPSTAQLQTIERHLGRKWGITIA
jgi:hypothetical protein